MNKLLLTCTALLAFCAYNAHAAATESATGTATVEVVQAIELTHNSSDKLNFASVYAKDGNNVTVSTGGARTTGDGFGTTTADHFTLSGPNGATVTLNVPATATMSKQGGGSISATLTPSQSGTINLTGTDVTIDVGGSIAISSSTAIGSYEGTYNVTVSY